MGVWTRSTLLVAFVAGAVLCGNGAAALAAEDPEALIRQGVELRKAGQDARAEGYFRRAYQLAATSRTAAQLGLVELAVDDFIHAEEHLTEALGYQDAWIHEHLAVLQESREVARRNLFHVEVFGAPPNATITLDGARPRPLPLGGIVWIDPGRSATIRIEAAGYRPAVLETTGAAGEGRRIALEMQPQGQAPVAAAGATVPATVVDGTPTAHALGSVLRIAAVATAVAGVAAGIVGAVFYEQGTSKLHEYQTAIRSNGAIHWNPQDDDWEAMHNKGVALLIVGGVGVAGGVSLFLLGNHERAVGEKVSFTAAPGAAFFSYRRSF